MSLLPARRSSRRVGVPALLTSLASLALPVVVVVTAAPAAAQEPPPPGDEEVDPEDPPEVDEPSEEMLRTCPELKDATGRAREQLIALFFGLDPRDEDEEVRARARELFDLGKAEDVALLSRYLEAPGPCRCIDGLKAVVVAHGADGMAWTLERLAAATPPRKGRLVSLLGAFTARESWRVLVALLADASPVPNPEQARIAPPGYEALRVCDHAFVALGTRIADRPRPEGVAEWRVDSVMPMEVRDKRIAALRELVKTDAELRKQVGEAPSLLDGAPAPKAERLRAALKAVASGE